MYEHVFTFAFGKLECFGRTDEPVVSGICNVIFKFLWFGIQTCYN